MVKSESEFQIIQDQMVDGAHWFCRMANGYIMEKKFIPRGFDIYLKTGPKMELNKGLFIQLPKFIGKNARK